MERAREGIGYSLSSLIHTKWELFRKFPFCASSCRHFVDSLRAESILRPLCFGYMVPLTVRTVMPGVVIQLPSAFCVKTAPGTLSWPATVLKVPVASS